MTFRAMVDSQHKSPLKKRRMQNSSDAIQQEVKIPDSALVSLELLLIVEILFDSLFDLISHSLWTSGPATLLS